MAESDKRCSLKAKKTWEKNVVSFLTFFVESIKRAIVDRNDDRHELSLFPNRVSGERNRPFICNRLELGRRETRSRTSGKTKEEKKARVRGFEDSSPSRRRGMARGERHTIALIAVSFRGENRAIDTSWS